MKKYIPTKEEQIESLIKFNPGIVLRKCFTLEEMKEMTLNGVDYYKMTFTVTRSEILEYIKKHYTIDELGLTPEGREKGYGALVKFYQSTDINKRDGLNVEKEGNKFKCYYFNVDYYDRTGDESGATDEAFYLLNEDEVYKKFVDGLGGGTGLTFTDI